MAVSSGAAPSSPHYVQGQTHPLLEQKDSGDKLRSLLSSEMLKCFTLVSKLEADLDHHALPTHFLLQRILFSFFLFLNTEKAGEYNVHFSTPGNVFPAPATCSLLSLSRAPGLVLRFLASHVQWEAHLQVGLFA